MKDINIQIEKTLESIEKIEQAPVPHFFETRLKVRMEKQLLATNNNWLIVKKPVWVMASLAIFLCINIYVLSIHSTENTFAKHQTQQPATIENFAKDYQLSSGSFQY